jgi:hypothetical protein
MTGHSSVGWVDIVVILAYLFAATQFGIDFEVARLIFALITAAYVIPGGIKAGPQCPPSAGARRPTISGGP